MHTSHSKKFLDLASYFILFSIAHPIYSAYFGPQKERMPLSSDEKKQILATSVTQSMCTCISLGCFTLHACSATTPAPCLLCSVTTSFAVIGYTSGFFLATKRIHDAETKK